MHILCFGERGWMILQSFQKAIKCQKECCLWDQWDNRKCVHTCSSLWHICEHTGSHLIEIWSAIVAFCLPAERAHHSWSIFGLSHLKVYDFDELNRAWRTRAESGTRRHMHTAIPRPRPPALAADVGKVLSWSCKALKPFMVNWNADASKCYKI